MVPVVAAVALFQARGGDDVVVVDPQPVLDQAKAAKFPVAPPRDLGSQWRSVSAAFQPSPGGGVLRIGYLTPKGGTVQLVESGEPMVTVLAREVGTTAQEVGEETINGVVWHRYEVREGELALVATAPNSAIAVVGRADLSELRLLARSVS